jgi:hypothetical protein
MSTFGASDLGGASSIATAACGKLSSPFPTSAGRIDDSLVPSEGSKENDMAEPALFAPSPFSECVPSSACACACVERR